nr:DUF2490 domain-containing protein [Cesiribacter sp. SM1]
MVVFCTFLCLPVAAQGSDDDPPVRTDQLLWFRYNLILPLQDKWQIEQELEERAFIYPWRQGEFRLRSHLIRKLGKGWEADAGFMFVWELEPIEPYRDDVSLRMEIRPHQQLTYQHGVGDRLSFEHSYRLEERFFEQQNSTGEYNNAGIAFERMRYRYELEIAYRLNNWMEVTAFEEIVLHSGPEVGPNPFDRNEAGAGVAFKLSDAFEIAAVYKYRYNPEGLGEEIVHQHVGQFILYHTINQN